MALPPSLDELRRAGAATGRLDGCFALLSMTELGNPHIHSLTLAVTGGWRGKADSTGSWQATPPYKGK